jgi:phage gp36-like protein
MSYAASADVVGEFKDLTVASSGTAISTDDMTRFLAEADAEINSRLSVKYTTPITGTESLLLMRQIAVWLVKDRIERITEVKTGRPVDAQKGQTPTSLRSQALELLKSICEGKIKLTDATLASTGDGVGSYSSENGTEHIFDRDTQQW